MNGKPKAQWRHCLCCCRRNDVGQCGIGLANFSVSVPVKVAGARKWTQISTYRHYTCGLEQDTGIAYCWGVRTPALCVFLSCTMTSALVDPAACVKRRGAIH